MVIGWEMLDLPPAELADAAQGGQVNELAAHREQIDRDLGRGIMW